jgi:uncharacterized protein (DUF952 family)
LQLIVHITSTQSWAEVIDAYTAPSLKTEGFIHCSSPEQVTDPANALFFGQKDLVLLCIDTRRLGAEVIHEDCYEAGQTFPHIYGPINRDAVIAVVPFPPDEDGGFSLPAEIEEVRAHLS